MNRLLLFAASCLATSHGAAAQDWSGSYVGLSLSSIQTQTDVVTISPGAAAFGEGDSTVIGAFAGYNWQLGDREVVGVEFDALFEPFGSNGLQTAGGAGAEFPTEFSNVMSLRLRLGYSIGNALPYVAAGLTRADYDFGTGGFLAASTRSRSITGSTVALGMDYLIGDAHQLRAEVRHTEFDDIDFPANFAVVPVRSSDINFTELRLGYAFRF